MIARRKIIIALGAGALIPRALFGQQTVMPVIGFLSSRSPDESAHLIAAFREGLAEAGYVEGKNVTIDYRWAEGKYERLPTLAAELVGRPVTIIATAGGSVSALAAKAATNTIPIVFLSGGDLVKLGLVASLNRPGANATGVAQSSTLLIAKRLELLRELRPDASQFGLLLNPRNPNAELEQKHALEASRSLGIKLIVLLASNETELGAAFTNLIQRQVGGLVASADPFFDGHRNQLTAWAAKHSIPAVYGALEYTIAGGLISYGPNFADTYREAGAYTGRVLKGGRPSELPVLQPSKYDFVINMKTARALGLKIPQSILVQATKVIE